MSWGRGGRCKLLQCNISWWIGQEIDGVTGCCCWEKHSDRPPAIKKTGARLFKNKAIVEDKKKKKRSVFTYWQHYSMLPTVKMAAAGSCKGQPTNPSLLCLGKRGGRTNNVISPHPREKVKKKILLLKRVCCVDWCTGDSELCQPATFPLFWGSDQLPFMEDLHESALWKLPALQIYEVFHLPWQRFKSSGLVKCDACVSFHCRADSGSLCCCCR